MSKETQAFLTERGITGITPVEFESYARHRGMTPEELIYKTRLETRQLEDATAFLAERGSTMDPEEFLQQLKIGIPRTTHNEKWWFNAK